MPTREIPRSEWLDFLDAFSRQHEGWRATAEVIGTDVPGDQLEANELPFRGISADLKGSDPDAISVIFGMDPAGEVTHIVHNASRVLFETTAAGEHAGMEIESADGTKTIIRFRQPASPELLDGITDEQRTRRAGGK
jgi:hypothetical protein